MNRHRVKEIHDNYMVDIYGNKHYYKDNIMYKKINKSGNVYYYNETGGFHRLDGPAVEYTDGVKRYYINGKRYSYNEWCEKVGE